jgi:hypothetical protein
MPRKIEEIFWFWLRWDRARLQEMEGPPKENYLEIARNIKIPRIPDLRHKNALLKAALLASEIMPEPKIDNSKRLRPEHPLAKFLVDSARLYESMATFQHRNVLENYLLEDSPVHPRRSLDQAYFWKLKSTRHRDRDQVVYRYTRPKFEHKFHYLNKKEMKERKREMVEDEIFDKRLIKGFDNYEIGIDHKEAFDYIEDCEWSGHLIRQHRWCKECSKQSPRYNTCYHCFDQSRKIARAVMVDQLWMWILDENTILTCFPRRYAVGVKGKDPSGVQESIRKRLADWSKTSNFVRSVFDLALIILEECFNTFFDETKTDDFRPQVLDIFRESIGTVVSRSIIRTYLY